MAAAAAAAPSFREVPGGWVTSPRWDLFWMFAALWGAVLYALLTSALGLLGATAVLAIGNTWIAVCHSWSTTYMVIASPLLRDARRGNRWKFTWAPLAIVSGSLGLGLAIGLTQGFPERFPLTGRDGLWALYLTLFWVGHFWHFGNQDFGVLSIYRMKAGQRGMRDRRVDKAFAVAMMFAIQPIVYLKAVGSSPFSETVFSFLPLSREGVAAGAAVAVGVALVLTAAIVAFELRKSETSLPKLLYYFVMLSHPVVLYFAHWKLAFLYLIVYFWSHWFIAIGLVGRINTNHHVAAGASPGLALWRHVRSFGVFALAAGIFYAGYGDYSLFSGGDYKETLAAVWPDWAWVIGLVLGAFLAEQLLHYYCDRCLFRFRDPAVRRAVAPLL